MMKSTMRLIGIITIAVVGALIIFCGVTCLTCVGAVGTATATYQNAQKNEEVEQKAKETTLPSPGVEIVSIAATKGSYSDYLNVIVRNTSDKTVKSVEVNITMCDEFGDNIGTFGNIHEAKVLDPDSLLKPGQTKTGKLYLWSWTYRYPQDPKVSRVLYEDGTIWPDDYYSTENPK